MRIEPKIWVWVAPNGERHTIDHEPLEGLAAWLRGLPGTVIEYGEPKVIHVKKGPT